MTADTSQARVTGDKVKKFFGEIYQIWVAEKPAQFAAALAYYSIFSFVPLIYLVFTIADMIFTKLSVSEWFYREAAALLGGEVAVYLQNGVANLAVRTSNEMTLTSIIGLGALVFSASMIFSQIQHTLNAIWRVPPPVRTFSRRAIRNRLLTIVSLFGAALLLIIAAILNFGITFIAAIIQLELAVALIGFIVLMGMATLSFTLIYKLLSNGRVAWRDAAAGSAAAGLLVAIMIHVLGSYLGAARFSSALESAGAMAVLLTSFYMLGQIFVLGAVFIRVFSGIFGLGISPQQPSTRV